MWLNFFNFDLKIIRQGSVFINCEKSLKILTLSMLKHAEMGCQISADPGSPRVKPGNLLPRCYHPGRSVITKMVALW